MPDRERHIEVLTKAYECCKNSFDRKCEKCPYEKDCCHDGMPMFVIKKMVILLKEQEARELTMDEWREWKADSRRNPICMLWENDTSPIWILNPNDVHEPALLMGKLKLFTGKPTFEQCKAVKWE